MIILYEAVTDRLLTASLLDVGYFCCAYPYMVLVSERFLHILAEASISSFRGFDR